MGIVLGDFLVVDRRGEGVLLLPLLPLFLEAELLRGVEEDCSPLFLLRGDGVVDLAMVVYYGICCDRLHSHGL